jgi:hypothetical protein
MLGSVVLEVAIGMVFVYLLLSLLCSAIGEYLEAKSNNRAKYLRQGIELLLNETTRGQGIDLAQQFYAHGLVRPLYRTPNKPPSYIPARTFALALWNIATADAQAGNAAAGVTTDLSQIRASVAKLPNPELRTALLTLIDEAGGDLARARRNVEEWYDAMMNRVSGWYKRRTAVLMLILGFVVAAAINADSITLAQALWRDGPLRRSIVAASEQQLAKPATDPLPATATADERDKAATGRLEAAYRDVQTLGLPIGWVTTSDTPDDPRLFPRDLYGWPLKLFGLLITGFAISQGAPFWFDLLNRFMVVRSTVKPNEKSEEQPSKERSSSEPPPK